MDHPSQAEVADLRRVASEVRDAADERGYRVGVALSQDDAFTQTRHAGSALVRSLVLEAVRRGASQAGMQIDDTAGGGLDIVTISDGTIRRYRVKGLKLTADGTYEVICGQRRGCS